MTDLSFKQLMEAYETMLEAKDPYKTLELKVGKEPGIPGYRRPSFNDIVKLAKKKGKQEILDALWELKKRESRKGMNKSSWHNDYHRKLQKEKID